MEPAKPNRVRSVLVRALLAFILFFALRFAYVVTIRGESCDGDFCFFALTENLSFAAATLHLDAASIVSGDPAQPHAVDGSGSGDLWTSKGYREGVQFYSSVFQDLIAEGYLSPSSDSLCVGSPEGQDVYALKEIGVLGAIGIAKKAAKPLVVKGQPHQLPFGDDAFDFAFFGAGGLDRAARPADFAAEIARTLRPEGLLVVHTKARDTYSLHSFIDLFNCCRFVRSREIDGFEPSMPRIREIVMKKEVFVHPIGLSNPPDSDSKCSVPGFKQELVRAAEALIAAEPLKPWLTLKRNIKNVKYLPSMADISFKQRYVYIDVGARSYGSSIASWFKKQYPKQNKTFEIYAIEADRTFHEQYRSKKGVTLLPYAAWTKNESLFFEINGDPGDEGLEKGRGMGRIRPVQSAEASSVGHVDEIKGFDFADWLKKTVSERDFVVMKMDVEGTEFDLIPRLFETGAICLIDEVFLECHYNRFQRCCPGVRSAKYHKTYAQCLDLFTSLRQSGVLVHQWW